MKNKSFLFVTSFILKILALLTMTLDHIGYMMIDAGNGGPLETAFRIIGRIALPLFCFMISEGVLHTKKIGHYFLRLGIMGTLVSLAIALVEYLPMFDGFSVRYEGNIFVDLLLGAIAVYFLSNKKAYLKPLAIIPLGIGILSFIVMGIELQGVAIIHWFPFFLRPQYQFYGILLIILFYVAHILKNIFLKQYSKNSSIPVESLEGTTIDQISYNLISVLMLVLATVGLLVMSYVLPSKWIYQDYGIQMYALIAGAFILLYNGKRGYNAKWFQYGCYIYYPLHMLLIYGIAMLIM